MKSLASAATVGLLSVWSLWSQNPTTDFQGSQWIWYSSEQSHPSKEYPATVSWFRTTLDLPENLRVQSAELIIAADNLYTLSLNGRFAGQSEADPNAWNRPKRFDVARLLSVGVNVLAVEAANTAPGPAGLLVKLVIQLENEPPIVRVSDGNWKCRDREEAGWDLASFDDHTWKPPHQLGTFGVAPWNEFAVPATATPAGLQAMQAGAASGGFVEIAPPEDFSWPEGIVYLGEDCSLYIPPAVTGNSLDSLRVTMFTARKSRAFPEHDLPAPLKMGRKLYALQPARPGVSPQLLLDVGDGAIGSPSVSFDGQRIHVALARAGSSFFHIYRLPAEGGSPIQLTDGPFHDIDPVELPDGRVVFTSTRIGTFEEYHGPPSRALFIMEADGHEARPITHTLIFDNEPEVMADGRILFIRSDNFFDRGKVETLLHAVHPDGTEGYTEFGLDLGPEYGSRLRSFYCGSPAPLPDGRVAFLSSPGITVGRPGSAAADQLHLRVQAGDVAALPDGQLLCTIPQQRLETQTVNQQKRYVIEEHYEKIGILNPDGNAGGVVILLDSTNGPVHSPVYLGARSQPPTLVEKVDPPSANNPQATGFLFCQDARFTQNTTAGWPHVRAIRVLAGKGLTTRSSHAYIVHGGSDVTELGTVPLAPDGSFFIEVPADTAIAFQAVDAEGRSELNEMSWIYVRPGEHRGCIGCHQSRQSAPPFAPAPMQAMQTSPLKLLGQGAPHRFRGNNAAVTGLMELQFDRFREVASLNRHADTRESLATGADEVREQIELIESDLESLRISAAQRLAIFRHQSAAGSLAWLSREGGREARVAAAIALATCGNRESVEPLLAALDDVDSLVAQAAALALENLTGHAEVFNPFVPASGLAVRSKTWREWFWRHAGASSQLPETRIGTMNPAGRTCKSGLPKTSSWEGIELDLVRQLETGDRDQARRAAVALGHLGGDAARHALRQYVRRERDENPYPEWQKQHSGDNARFNALAEVNPRALQAATRALGYLKDTEAVPLLIETLERHAYPTNGNLFLAEAAVEALGRIGTTETEQALLNAFARLDEYHRYVGWYGDHPALYACHASPVHYFIIEALDALGFTGAGPLAPQLIRSVPTDPDRALFLANDDYETLTGRVLRRSGMESKVVESCLALLGEARALREVDIETALKATHRAWAGKPDPENRAAQILSVVCRDRQFEPRIRSAFERYRSRPASQIPRLYDKGIPGETELPVKNWVCFFLARALGNLADPRSVDTLLAALVESPPEAAGGRPDPLGAGVHFLHNELTPCWRAAAAWALGRIGEARSIPVLMRTVENLDNAPDTRHAAAVALGLLAKPDDQPAIQELADHYPEISTRRVLREAGRNHGNSPLAATSQRPPKARPENLVQTQNSQQR